jgi:hypothetical protein
MSHVALNITMSLDGFVTGPNDEPGRGLGDDGEVLHYSGAAARPSVRRASSCQA